MIHIVTGFGVVNKAEVDVFLELSCFFDDPMDVGHFISGSSAFSKSSFNIWKFTVHILLKPDLQNVEHYFASTWDECSCAVVWAFFGITFWIGMKTDLFQSCGHCWVFQICWHIECSTFTALISHASKVMLKILQARLQQHMNYELPESKLDLAKAEEPEIKLPTSAGSSKKQESSRKTSISVLTMPKPLCRSQHTVENS